MDRNQLEQIGFTQGRCLECTKTFVNLNSKLNICSYKCQEKILNTYDSKCYSGIINSEDPVAIKRAYLKNYKFKK